MGKRSRISVTLLFAVFLLSSLSVIFVNVHAASPIMFDSKSTATPCMGNLACSTLSWSHTVGSGADGILLVSVEVGVAPGHTLHTVGSIQYGTSALTFMGNHQSFDGFDELEMWYLLKPAAGLATITVNIAAVDVLFGGAVSYFNVGGIVDFEGDTAKHSVSNPISTTVKLAVSGDLVVDTVYASVGEDHLAFTVSPGTLQTQRWSLTATVPHGNLGSDVFMGGSDKSASSPVTMTWSSTLDLDFWLLDAVALAPPAVIPEYPLGLPVLAVLMIIGYGLVRRRTRNV